MWEDSPRHSRTILKNTKENLKSHCWVEQVRQALRPPPTRPWEVREHRSHPRSQEGTQRGDGQGETRSPLLHSEHPAAPGDPYWWGAGSRGSWPLGWRWDAQSPVACGHLQGFQAAVAPSDPPAALRGRSTLMEVTPSQALSPMGNRCSTGGGVRGSRGSPATRAVYLAHFKGHTITAFGSRKQPGSGGHLRKPAPQRSTQTD